MLVNQSKTTYQQRIQEDGSISKEILGIEILTKYRDSYIKIWQPIKITRILPTRVRKRSQFRKFRWTWWLKLVTFCQWAKTSKETTSVEQAALHTHSTTYTSPTVFISLWGHQLRHENIISLKAGWSKKGIVDQDL